MFSPTREHVRRFFCDVWRKCRERTILEGEETVAAALIERHPEYHALLENPENAVGLEFTPENGRMNPFLHLSLHLAIAEQIGIDQPPGILAIYHDLRQRTGEHEAEHIILECLAETLWNAQRDGSAMDGERYLERIRRACRTGNR